MSITIEMRVLPMIYLDNAATTFPKPSAVLRSMEKAVNFFGANPGRSGHFLSMFAAEEVFICRERAAKLFNASGPEYIIFTQNTTHALNIAIQGALKPGTHVVISDMEHNSVIRPLKYLERLGVYYDEATVDLYDNEKTVLSFKSRIKSDTRAIICTHASNVWGRVLPIREIGKLAKDNGLLFIVDGAQTAGSRDIDISLNHIDMLCLPGHKGLYGPQGTGMLVFGRDINIEPLTFGGTGTNSIEPIQPTNLPERFESGTLNTPGIVGLSEGINFVNYNTTQNIGKKETYITASLHKELSKIDNVKLYTNYNEELYGNVLSFNIEGKQSNEVANFLDDNNIFVRSGLHCSPAAHSKMGTLNQGAVRVSVGVFNSIADVERLLHIILKLVK